MFTGTTPTHAAGVLATIDAEVGTTFPSFALRGLDWGHILARHRDAILATGGSLPSLQRLFAELGDAHTWVRDGRLNGRWPYRLWLGGTSAVLVDVPRWTAGWDAGARPGDALMDVDVAGWWERTSATPRTRAMVAGYRVMTGTIGDRRAFRIRKADGGAVEWTEACPPVPWRDPVSWRILSTGTGNLDIRGWIASAEWSDAVDAALADLSGCPRLIVNLRGNVGGNLIAAQAFRDRLLTGRTVLGTIRHSRGDGTLGDPHPITGEPPPSGRRWHRPVRFLIDRQTYSASEDAILGLQGLPHVQVAEEPSGGGSGRPRTVPLMDGMVATISTALTYDRHGRCIEGAGIPVDLALAGTGAHRGVPYDSEAILSTADTGW